MLDDGPQLGAIMPAVIKNTSRKGREPDVAVDALARNRLNERIQATKMEPVPITSLHPNPRNAKKHPDRQITLLCENYSQFGFTQPIAIDEDSMILCGHARHIAALKGGVSHLPAIRLSHLTAIEKRALAIADK
jgi:ParB-like nuclease domain